jgi:hypothetical protein
MVDRPTSYVAKTGLGSNIDEDVLTLDEKTMYRGRDVAVGDEVFVFDAEHRGGSGLALAATVVAVEQGSGTRRRITVRRTATARRPIGRAELKVFRGVEDGSPQAELDFKLYRQPTNKIVGIAESTAAFLRDRC